MNLTGRWSEVYSFRRIVTIGLPYASDVLASDNREWAHQLLTDPKNDSWFLNKPELLKEVGGSAGLGTAMTASEITVFRLSVDAASLVFMHSALDGCVHDLCRVCALAAPIDWEPFVSEQKVSLANVKSAGYPALFDQRLAQHLTALERESVVKRIDRLFQLCRPAGDYVRTDYSYDRGRLEAIDRERQAVIHGDGVMLADVGSTLDYLRETGLFLLGMVNHRYGVRMDPQLITTGHGWAQLSKPLQPTSVKVSED